MPKVKKQILVALLMGCIALAVRLPGLGQFMTADESNWMLRSGEFWHKAIDNTDAGGTFITTHPGVLTLWLSGAGVYAQEHRRSIAVDEGTIQYFRRVATLPIAVATSLCIAAIAYVLIALYGFRIAVLGAMLLTFEPYVVGMSKIVHLDALLALCMLTALLYALLFTRTHRWSHLLIAGVFTGLAMSNKLVLGVWVLAASIPLFAVRSHWQWQKALRHILFLVGVSVLTFYAIWPALWVKPDLSQSFERDVVNVATQEHVAIQESSEEPAPPELFYVSTVLSRTSPVVFVLVATALLVSIRDFMKTRQVSDHMFMLLYAIGFLALITLAAKKADRYALPALATFPVIAAIWWQQFLQKWKGKIASTERYKGFWKFGIAVPIIVSGVTLFLWYPYPIAYSSSIFPDTRPSTQQGWGEGLDEAARWLNEQPLAEKMYVASWYPSVLGTYFHGKALSLSSRNDHRIAFLVIYRNMYGRSEEDIASNVLDELEDQEPVHTVYIHGVPYVWIYKTENLALFYRHVGEITGPSEIGQTIPISIDDWDSVEIGFATFSDRNNTEDVILDVYENVNDSTPIRSTIVNASNLENESWYRFTFEPISNSAGNTYYVSVRSPSSYAGNAITVRYVDSDLEKGQMVFFREALGPTDAREQFIREGDIAYRIPAEE